MRWLESPTSRRRLSLLGQQSQSSLATTISDQRQSDITSTSTRVPDVSTDDDYENIGSSPSVVDAGAEDSRHPTTNATVSRASSIISTGTKMSYRTLPQPSIREPATHSTQTHSGPIDIVLGRRNFRITARPGSILSISSFDHPTTDAQLPPYEANAPGAESNVTLTQDSIVERDDREEDENNVSTDEELAIIPFQPTPRRVQQSGLVVDTSPGSIGSLSRPPSPPSPPLSPATTSANAISAHYTHVVRTIDTNHRAEIQQLIAAHAAELSQTRNSIDSAYREEFRQIRQKSEAQIASLSAQVQELENLLTATLSSIANERVTMAEERAAEAARSKNESERRLEQLRSKLVTERDEAVRKARNEVEDVWEGRWRDRMRLAGEEVGAAFGEKQKVALCWDEEVKRRWPEHVDEIRASVEGRLRRERAGERRRSGSGSGTGTGHH